MERRGDVAGHRRDAPVLDGRTMVWAGHPPEVRRLPDRRPADGRQAFNFVAELRDPAGPGRQEDWSRPGSLADFSRVRGVGLRLARRAVDRPGGAGDVPLPDGRSRPAAPLDLRPTTLLGDAAHPMYPIGSNGASQAILDARVLAGCLGATPATSTRPWTATRRSAAPPRPPSSQANRGLGPELPMVLVEERAPEGFDDIADVITAEEIARVHRGVPQDGRLLPRRPPGGNVAARRAVRSLRTPGSVRLRLRTARRDAQSGTRASPSRTTASTSRGPPKRPPQPGRPPRNVRHTRLECRRARAPSRAGRVRGTRPAG